MLAVNNAAHLCSLTCPDFCLFYLNFFADIFVPSNAVIRVF